MHSISASLMMTFALAAPGPTPSPEQVALYEDRVIRYTGGDYQDEAFHYRLLKPSEVVPGKKYPLVISLHGAGERGDDNVAQLKYLPKWLADPDYRTKFPCFVFAPQCRTNKRWVEVPWSEAQSTPTKEIGDQMAVVVAVLDQLEKELPIDSARLYLTGLSMGGYGSWDLAIRFPQRFAAVVPICGGGDERQAARLSKVPLWAYHGSADKAVPVERSRSMINAIRAAGGNPKYTELEGVGHDSWTAAYTDSEGVVPWMFAQVKK